MTTIPKNIIISRSDSIGDVVLTLPVAGVLKKAFPQTTLAFLGKQYTRPVIEACSFVDVFLDVDDFLQKPVLINGQQPEAIVHVFPVPALARRAKSLKIPLRIGTTNRLYHWTTCNQLVRLSRKNSPLHEAQLNVQLLQPFGIHTTYSADALGALYGLNQLQPLAEEFSRLISPNRYNLILHPKSQGSGREWPLEQYAHLVRLLDPQRFQIFISGTEKERPLLQPLFDEAGHRVTDISGKLSLAQFISFIHHCDGLVASGTGPLHLAAALGKDALGLFPPIRPVHPGRWRPLGKKAKVFVLEKDCTACKKNPVACACMNAIEPLWIKNHLDRVSEPHEL